MTAWTIRDLHESDVERTLRLHEQTRDLPDAAPVDLIDLIAALRSGQPAVVAVSRDEVVGAAVAEIHRDRGSLLALMIHPAWRGKGIGSALLHAIEDRVMHAGARRIEALLGPGQVGEEALINRGFRPTRGLTHFVKDEPLLPSEVSIVDAWGGELIDASAWDAIAGMSELKALIDERVVLPVIEAELAEHYGLRPPSTLMLFGPPGTGKTSFARAIAGRLGWPFVELLPSKLAGAEAGLAAELRRAFRELSQLEHVILFVDEFDEIASNRQARPEMQGVVNELLKAIPPFRAQPGRMLVCATNFVDALDPAVIRPGRFDLMMPVGPPDDEARRAMWTAALAGVACDAVDLDALVAASTGFTPGDLMLAAQRAAFAGFSQAARTATRSALGTDDFLAAIAATPATLDAAIIAEFHASSAKHRRC